MSSSAVTKIPRVPPSTFSALLRRSKFASYDPKIGQIYTTYDGSAHRGDWGLKRPLAVRSRRNARLIIGNIDTLYQQTEWKNANTDALTLRKLQEMDVTPKLENEGWGLRFNVPNRHHTPRWLHDSDYANVPREETERHLEASDPLPDPRTMGPKRLERYIRKLRRLGPEFRDLIIANEQKNVQPNSTARPLTSLAKLVTREQNRFIIEKLMSASKGENSTFIRPMPHPTAGLTYVHSNDYQTNIDGKALPGRRLHFLDHIGTDRILTVGVAGWVAKERITFRKNNADVTTTDYGTLQGEPRKELDAGKDVFRPKDCILYDPPQVVGTRPQRLDETFMTMQVLSWSGVNESRYNPHKPGTVAYIIHPPDPQGPASGKNSRVSQKARSKSQYTMTSYARPRPPLVISSAQEKGTPIFLETLKQNLGRMVKKIKDPLDDGSDNNQ